MDILTSNTTEKELCEEQNVIGQYLEFCKAEQVKILDSDFYEQYKGNFIVDSDRDFIGDIADENFQEEYGFLYGKSYEEVLKIDNINQAISENNLDKKHQEKYSLFHGRSLEEILASS